jgi:hypothetical protein
VHLGVGVQAPVGQDGELVGRPMPWSLEQAYDVYPQIEEEFSAALDESRYV